MKEKVKVRGKFRLYLQWPLYLSALFIIMGLFVGLVSVKAGIIVSSFTVVYVGIALWIYFPASAASPRPWWSLPPPTTKCSCR